MRKRLPSVRFVMCLLVGALAGCELDADLPSHPSGTPPSNAAVTLSGAGARDDADAAVAYGDGSRITDIHPDHGNAHVADGASGGANGGAPHEGSEISGGRASKASGGAAAGSKDDSPKGEGGGTADGGTADGGTASDQPAEPPELWFSEYVEGSSSNKALEIATRTRATLDGCKVSTYFNGKTEPTVVANLSGVLEAGSVLTLCTSTVQEKLGDRCNQVGNLNFNGDDAIALSCNGKILDVIGQIGVDPGSAWGDGMNTTVDHTWRRKCSVQHGAPPSAEVFDPNLEWQSFPLDTFDGLGVLGC